MTYDEALVMPGRYAVMNEAEMTYVEGGALSYEECSLTVLPNYLTKAGALMAAEKFAGKELWDGKTYGKERLAAEIFAHTVAFYASIGMYAGPNGAVKALGKTIFEHANPINLGGDNFAEVAAFYACWVFAVQD